MTATAIYSQPTVQKKRSLQNRINDLSWKDWLKFQKSFFHTDHDRDMYAQLIDFFTKEYNAQHRPARIGIIGDQRVQVSSNRNIVYLREGVSLPTTQQFDFLIVDWRNTNLSALPLDQIEDRVNAVLSWGQTQLRPGAFLASIASEVSTASGVLPLPWLIANIGRSSMRLRDEKIALDDDPASVPTHVNVFQALPEIGPALGATHLQIGKRAPVPHWIKPKPKPRKGKEILHPAKFPEDLITDFICALSSPGDVVFDPMGGTGSTVLAATGADRRGVMVELGHEWAEVARERLENSQGLFNRGVDALVIQGDARETRALLPQAWQDIGYCVTSPPYWQILHSKGMHVSDEGQQDRRARGLPTVYSTSEQDLGNVRDYQTFLEELASIYRETASLMAPGTVLTFITKNVKYERAQYPIAWDLVGLLCQSGERLEYAGTTFWCQDDIGLKPFGMGCDWVSNILHNYCVHLRVR